jgi:hypothetical protein
MFLGEDEMEIRRDDIRRLKVLFTALGLALLVIGVIDYFS